jgi:hypothetical protein
LACKESEKSEDGRENKYANALTGHFYHKETGLQAKNEAKSAVKNRK